MNIRKLLGAIALTLLSAIPAIAQAAPSPLQATPINFTLGYSNLASVNTNNGLYSSFAVPLFTKDAKYSFTTSARADDFQIASPSVNEITFGPEERFQFSNSTFLGGAVFQPFVAVMGGVARSACVATMSCAAGQNVATHGAFKFTTGVDVRLTGGMFYRVFQLDVHRSTIFPGGSLVTQNFASVTTGLNFRF